MGRINFTAFLERTGSAEDANEHGAALRVGSGAINAGPYNSSLAPSAFFFFFFLPFFFPGGGGGGGGGS